MNQRKKQSGFAHLAILTIILGVAVIGLLGNVFWQNFMQPKKTPDSHVSTSSKTKSSSSPKVNEIALDKSITDTSGMNLTLSYPSSWSDTHTPESMTDSWVTDSIKINSPDGKYTVDLTTHINGVGGACDTSDASFKMYQVELYKLDGMQNFTLWSVITTGDSSGASYAISLRDNDPIYKDPVVGGSGCDLGIGIFRTSNSANSLNISLNDYEYGKGITAAQISQMMSTDNYRAAIRIAKSLHQS